LQDLPWKGTDFLRKDAEKNQSAFNESGYQSQSRYNKTGNSKQAREKIVKWLYK